MCLLSRTSRRAVPRREVAKQEGRMMLVSSMSFWQKRVLSVFQA